MGWPVFWGGNVVVYRECARGGPRLLVDGGSRCVRDGWKVAQWRLMAAKILYYYDTDSKRGQHDDVTDSSLLDATETVERMQ